MSQKNDKIPLWVDKYQIYVLISSIDDSLNFEIEYIPDENIPEKSLKEEIERLITTTLNEVIDNQKNAI